MSEWWDPVEVKEKKKRISASGVRNAASSLLGLISIISALIALSITISFYDSLHDLGAGWGFGFFLFVVPLMIFSFALSMIGIVLSSGTREGKRLCKIGLILTFSPILMLFIMDWMLDRKNYSYVDGVQFNKEKTVLIDYSENKKETNYTIPDSVTSIKNHAFASHKLLTGITIPDSVTSIGDNAFQFCTNLKSITIGKGVTYISNYAFANCENLAEITFLGDAPEIASNIFSDTTTTIYRKPKAKGWGDTFGKRPVKLISEKS